MNATREVESIERRRRRYDFETPSTGNDLKVGQGSIDSTVPYTCLLLSLIPLFHLNVWLTMNDETGLQLSYAYS